MNSCRDFLVIKDVGQASVDEETDMKVTVAVDGDEVNDVGALQVRDC